MKRVLSAAIILALFLGFAGCAKTVKFPGSAVVPAAQAVAKVGMDKNENVHIDLRVNHLARPQSLVPPRYTYVVWLQTPDNRIVNFGLLKVGGNLKGRITGITTLREFRIIVSAEDDPTATLPGSQVVLTTQAFRVK